LSQGEQSLAEGGPLVKTQKMLGNDSEFLGVVNVHTRQKKRASQKTQKNKLNN